MTLVIKVSSNSFVLVFSQSELFIYSFLTGSYFLFRKFYDCYQTTLASPSKIIDKVSIDCFVDLFKKLNTVNVENVHGDGFEIIDTNTVTGLNTELNAIITAKDVLGGY